MLYIGLTRLMPSCGGRLSVSLSVCLSVCPSVRPSRSCRLFYRNSDGILLNEGIEYIWGMKKSRLAIIEDYRLPSVALFRHCSVYNLAIAVLRINHSLTLRSTSALLLQQQPATISFAARAFCAAAPAVWNSLGVHTRSADTFLTFKNRLKTKLFKSCYS